MKIFNNSGDTIIEVLISIAVLSVIIVGAYVAANHSTLVLRDTQERTNALTLAQNQVEMLISWFQTNSSNNISLIPSSPSFFCFSNDLVINNSPTNCYVASNAVSSGPAPKSGSLNNPPFYYTVSDQELNTADFTVNQVNGLCVLKPITIKVDVTWQSLLGGQSRVTLFYRPSVTPSC